MSEPTVQWPDFYCPLEPAINAHAETVHRGTGGWVRRFGLLPVEAAYVKFEAGGLGWLVARAHPYAPPDELRLISDWYAWLFLRDDKADDSQIGTRPNELSDADARLLDILEGSRPARHEEPLAHALHDLEQRLLEYVRRHDLAPSWRRRFVRAVREHLEATLWEASNRARAVPPDLESYLRMRPLTGGLNIVTELVEIIEGRHLPLEVRHHEQVRRLTRASHNVVCWANDVFSLGKELVHGEVNNLVVVLRESRGLSLQQAVRRAVEMHDAEMRDFVDLCEPLPAFWPEADESLGRYVLGLRARIRGVLDWSRDSARYRAPDGAIFPARGSRQREAAEMISPADRASTGSENK